MLKAVVLIGSYFLGSVPFGLVIVKAWRGIDIRNYGSGNIGATNVLRAAGPGPAIAVFAADVFKGVTPVIAARQLFPQAAWLAVTAGMLAILGHSLSVFLKFRGGKGVATSLGVIIGLDPRVAGMGFGIWLVVLALSRYVSLSSMLAALGVLVLMQAFALPMEYRLFALVAAVFVIAKHRPNIVRLLQGKEARWGEKVSATGGDVMVKGVLGDPLVALAKEAVEEHVRFGRVTPAPVPVPPELDRQAGVFVCLKKYGQLRGCIGTIEAAQPNLCAEIIENAISTAARDPRFEPVTEDELDELEYTVDVLSPAERIENLDGLDPKCYGVIVESGWKRGLLLPDLDGVDTIEEQLSIAMQKAGIWEGDPLTVYRFQVIRHGG